ncbi:MAG TPA: hypothetical protein VLZ81_07850, partial [Blastocatellia bacterium]|nr:hypothetical protein [Blastocatellia bacterium]
MTGYELAHMVTLGGLRATVTSDTTVRSRFFSGLWGESSENVGVMKLAGVGSATDTNSGVSSVKMFCSIVLKPSSQNLTRYSGNEA